MKKPGAVTIFDHEHRTPYTYVGDQWVGYDNVQSLTEKVKYVINGEYGGWMTWNLDLDDFNGQHCNAGTYPLHKAINLALSGSVPTESLTTATPAPTQPPTTGTTTPYTGPSTTQGATTTVQGHFCAGKSNGLHPNPDSCSSFYNCGGGTGGIAPCPPGLLFNTDKKVCDWPFNLSAEQMEQCNLSVK
jgi:chitinase